MARARKAPALLHVVGFALSVCVAPATAQLPELERGEPVEITADRIDFLQDRDLYVAEGNVYVVQGRKSLRARWATFSGLTRLGVASGDVRYRDGSEVVEARFIQFDVDSLQGVIFGGEIDLGERGMRIAAEELVRTGEDRYRVFDARFTTCRCPDPDATVPWELKAGRTDVEIGGYGTSRNTTLEMLGVPIVWLPWLAYPVKTERQTGLLVPHLSLGGRNGFSVAQPIFWAARRDLNVTATPAYSEDRGFKQNLEIETVYGERSVTRMKGGFAWDEASPAPGNRFDLAPIETVGMARGYAELGHDQDLPADVRLKINATYITDNEYVLDFDDLRAHRSDRFLESSAFAFRHFGPDGRFGVELASLFADDLQSSEFDDRDPYLLQRWVDLEAEWLTGPVAGLPWLGFGVDANYEYFGRLDDPLSTFLHRGYATVPTVIGRRFVDTGISAIPDNMSPDVPADITRGDGLYQEGEPLFDRGHRATIHPRLSIPLRLFDVVEWNAEAGWRQTLYYSDERNFEQRGFATGRGDLLIRLARDYELAGGGVLEHRMIPRLSWVYVSQDPGQDRNPLFTPRTAVTQYRLRQRALDNIVRDPSDEIPATNRLVAAVDHRLYGGKNRAQLLGEFGLGFDYDFASGGRVGRFVAEGRRIRLGWTMNRFQVALDGKRGKVDEVFALSSVSWPWQIRSTFGYRFVPDGPDFFEKLQTDKFENFSVDFDEINQIFASVSLPLFDRFRLKYQANYTAAGSFFLTNSGSLDYISRCRCWAAGIQISESRDESLRFQFRYTIVGLGDDVNNPFDGGGWFNTQ